MYEPKLNELRLKDPLSTITRTERRNLLGASAIGILIVKTGLVPSRISALGIEFTQTDQRSLLRAIAAIVAYFLAAFLLYALSDFLAWRTTFQHTLMDMLEVEQEAELDANNNVPVKRITIDDRKLNLVWFRITKPASFVRSMFEFVLPIVIGICAISLLIRSSL